MTFSNPYFTAAVAIVLGLYLLDLVANLLNLRALKPDLPATFRDVYDADKYAKSQRYTRETTRFGLVESTISLAVFLAFWWLGGFGWLDGLTRGFGFGPVITGLVAIGILAFASGLLALPFEVYDTFVIEEKYGFNKTTPATFVMDHLKSLALALALGVPLVALVLYLFRSVENAWLYAWLAVSGISLVLAYLAPKIILPLFNKFSPLEDEALRHDIHAMAEKCDFPLTEVSVMDGSKRSSKSNAFFTGFGKNKKIALFDTLIEKHSNAELVAVLAHAIGPFKKKHIIQGMVIGILHTGVLFYLLSLFLDNASLFAAFGVAVPSVHFGFIFFGLLFKPINRVLSVAMAMLSRKNEFEADAFASEVTGQPDALVTALKKLSADNLSNLTPHPFYVFMYYSHPPMLERLRALHPA
ncbi:M48 family metallopeptidase [soil metagenome]